MSTISIGDLAQSFQLRRDNARLKETLTRLTGELSSGVTDNILARVRGNFGPLSGIERGMARAASYSAVIGEHRLMVSAMQESLSRLRGLAEISGALLTARDSGDPVLVRNAGQDALVRLSSALGTLNTTVGGRAIISGVDTDRAAVTDLETIMASLEAEISIAGATTADDVVTTVTGWFTAGGGYDTIGYTGGAAATVGTRLSDSEVADPATTAQDEAVRRYLAAMSLGGLLGRDLLAGDPAEQGRLARLAGMAILVAENGLVDLQADLGSAEGQIERADVEVRTETDALAIARAEIVGVDPYETAVDLEAAESQLQLLYAVTARLSTLSLAEYL